MSHKHKKKEPGLAITFPSFFDFLSKTHINGDRFAEYLSFVMECDERNRGTVPAKSSHLVAERIRLVHCFEKHHILPKCIGGSGGKQNYAWLYPDEHIFAHYLLSEALGAGKGKKHVSDILSSLDDFKRHAGRVHRLFIKENPTAIVKAFSHREERLKLLEYHKV